MKKIYTFILFTLLFISSCTTQDVSPLSPTIAVFNVSAKKMGSVPFQITAPISNSAGSFTYTSSNSAVATINGSTVTITGIGTTTITATQAADAGFSAGSTTTTFTVTDLEPPTFGTFIVSSKMMGSDPFQLAPPTSNSTGAFSYASSNTTVATINGSIITIVGVGTTTITATQTAFGTFASGSISANFVVTANIPPPLLQDNFEYAVSTVLSDISNSGWSIHSGNTFPIKTTSTTGLTFANYYGNGLGLAAILDANGADSNKKFAEQSEGNPIYISFVVKIKAPTVALIPITSYFLHTSSLTFVPASSSTFRGEIFAQPIPNDLLQYNFGLSFSATTPQSSNTLNKLNYDENYLVVLKYTSVIGDNNDSVSLYVFSANDDFSTEPSQPFIGPLSLSSAADIKPAAVCLRQYHADEDILVDGIRVSTIWDLFKN